MRWHPDCHNIGSDAYAHLALLYDFAKGVKYAVLDSQAAANIRHTDAADVRTWAEKVAAGGYIVFTLNAQTLVPVDAKQQSWTRNR